MPARPAASSAGAARILARLHLDRRPRGLVDHVGVRRDRARDHRVAEARGQRSARAGPRDPVTGCRVKDHGRRVRGHERLDHDGHRDVLAGQAPALAVRDRGRRSRATPSSARSRPRPSPAVSVELRLVEPRVRRRGAVLAERRRPHREPRVAHAGCRKLPAEAREAVSHRGRDRGARAARPPAPSSQGGAPGPLHGPLPASSEARWARNAAVVTAEARAARGSPSGSVDRATLPCPRAPQDPSAAPSRAIRPPSGPATRSSAPGFGAGSLATGRRAGAEKPGGNCGRRARVAKGRVAAP